MVNCALAMLFASNNQAALAPTDALSHRIKSRTINRIARLSLLRRNPVCTMGLRTGEILFVSEPVARLDEKVTRGVELLGSLANDLCGPTPRHSACFAQ